MSKSWGSKNEKLIVKPISNINNTDKNTAKLIPKRKLQTGN